MQPSPLRSVLGTLYRLAGSDGPTDLSDADLLEHFRAHHEEAAFTLLVGRHGPMVLAVCRRVLGDLHDAEDAFQATFLVLVRSAGAIRKQSSLASYLYGVAYRVAARARARAAARRAHERKAPTSMPDPDPSAALADRELRAALEEEMHGLPEKYRAPLVLCGLEGKTHEEAAQELRWPKSSVTARLARARALLQERLAGRGFAVSAGAVTALLAVQPGTAAVPAGLTLATVRLALAALTGTAAATEPAVALADHVLQGTTATRLTALLALLLTVGLAGAGVALLMPPQGVPDGPGRAAASRPDPAANRPADALPEGVLARLGSGKLRHGAVVSDLAFSPDGKRLVSGGAGQLRVWDAATGRLEQRFRVGSAFDFPVVAFTPSGALLTSTPQDAGCRLLDVVTGKELRRVSLRAPDVAFGPLTVSPGGRLAAVADWDNVRVFDAATGKETLHLPVPDLPGGLQVGLSANGKLLAYGDNASVIRIHDTTTGKRIIELKGEWHGSLSHLTFSPDGQSLAGITGGAPGSGGAVVVWDVAQGKERYRFPGMASSGTCVFTPDGKGLVASENRRGRDLTLWSTADGKEVRCFVAGTWFTAAAFSADGKVLAGAANEGAIVLWDVSSGKRLPQCADEVHAVVHLQYSADGQQLVGAAGDLIVWDPATGRELRRVPDGRLGLDGAVSPSGKLLAVPEFGATIAVRDAATGKTLRTLPGHGFMPIRVARFTPDERYLITACEDDRAILVWNLADGAVVHRLTDPVGHVALLAVSPDGRWLASCSWHRPLAQKDDELRLWDLRTGHEAKSLPHHFTGIYDLAFAPDGSRLAAAGLETGRSPPGRVQVWEVSTGKDLLAFDTHTEMVKRVAFSPDGRTLATGGADATLRLWELATGSERLRFQGHEGEIKALVYGPAGRSLAASSLDAPVFVWDVAGRPGPRQPLSAEDLLRCWDDLAGAAPAGFRAIRCLAAVPDQALPFLRERLGPVPPADPRGLRQLLDALDSNDFAQRKKAAQDLSQLADRAVNALKQEAEQTTSVEVRRALGEILASAGAPVAGEQRRTVRVVEAVEAMGTPEAARWLDKLAGGAPGARLTREAGAARDRLRSPRP
jgi:RNA polymerase sigma factor (sigma-70 family)